MLWNFARAPVAFLYQPVRNKAFPIVYHQREEEEKGGRRKGGGRGGK